MIRAHRRLSHRRRVSTLAGAIAGTLSGRFPLREELRCLDVGCGDFAIAEAVAREEPRTRWSGVDVYPLPGELADDERWRGYRQFDGRHLPFADASFDVALLCDVLHHAEEEALPLLREAGRVATAVIVKDHFESSRYSRIMLKLLDVAGNWAYGVGLPRRYLTRESFRRLTRDAGLGCETMLEGIDLYAHLPLVGRLLRPEWQFLALLRRSGAQDAAGGGGPGPADGIPLLDPPRGRDG